MDASMTAEMPMIFWLSFMGTTPCGKGRTPTSRDPVRKPPDGAPWGDGYSALTIIFMRGWMLQTTR